MAAQAQEYKFQAETKQLLDLMIHSLYTNKEIFLRELISNASDAIDRLRFEALTNPELLADVSPFEIRLQTDEQSRTLTVTDNGIGMSREEVIANIGTIARSGTRELRERIKEGNTPQMIAELIGQFGVGFYSAFMVSDKVTLITRRASQDTATLWESTGDGTYTVSDYVSPRPAGTSITLHLKPVDAELGIEDYTDPWVLSRIVRRYSDFVAYPIKCAFPKQDPITGGAQGEEKGEAELEDRTLNSMKPLWVKPISEVSEQEYQEFYHHISHDWSEPLKTLALKAEGTVEYESLLFIPSQAPYDLFYHGAESGLRLYAKRVMIMERCEALLPRYLRFVKGVVDSADLPLNISRQTLQQDRHIAQIGKWITKKVLDALQEMMRDDFDLYLRFWKQFGRVLKEGVSSDYDNRARILSLLLFESSNDPENLTTLGQCVSRMKPEQEEIFYLTGETRSVVENSPHLEAFKEKGYEVLYLTDPVDELLVQAVMDYEGKKLKSAAKGIITLGTEEERRLAESELKEKEEEAASLFALIQKHLDANVKQVRLTNRLTSSPVCLVGAEMDYSPQLERLLMKGKGGGPKQRRIMELNPRHELFNKMLERHKAGGEQEAIGEQAELLWYYALLAEGSEISDPVRFSNLLAKLMTNSL